MKTARNLSAVQQQQSSGNVNRKPSWFRRGGIHNHRQQHPLLRKAQGKERSKLLNFLPGRSSHLERTNADTDDIDDDRDRIQPLTQPNDYGSTMNHPQSVISGDWNEEDAPSFRQMTFFQELAFTKSISEKQGEPILISLLVPEKNPFFWLIMNGTLLVGTLAVLVLFSMGSIALEPYVITYTLVNTCVWDFQIFLTIWYNARFCDLLHCELLFKSAIAIQYTYITYVIITTAEKDDTTNTTLITLQNTYWLLLWNIVAYIYVFFDSYSYWRTADDLTCLEEHFAEDFTIPRYSHHSVV